MPCMSQFVPMEFGVFPCHVCRSKVMCFGMIFPRDLRLLKNYLNNRTQRVKYKNAVSNPLKITMGVPQGSIIGPLMFLLYITSKLSAILYADSNFFFSHSCKIKLIEIVNHELSQIYCWLNTNKLTLNINKSKYIHKL